MKEIIDELMKLKDEEYASFHCRLVPNLNPETIIGVRTPALRKLAKKVKNEPYYENFLQELPHLYYEENQLHGFLISEIKDFDVCIKKLELFLPYIDNWATCDQTSPKIFKKRKEDLLPFIKQWITSDHTYTIRFGIGMLMQHFLDEDFHPDYLKMVAGIQSDEYYVNMEIAWYMATALAKQWDATIPYMEERFMEKWVHNKTIQKARESYRITAEQKQYLKTLKI
ncbi:MAG: DNA alkylation repair protein [Lachnospiraceae bacterium]